MAAILESTTLSANYSVISVCFSLKAIKCLGKTILYNILLELYGLLLWCFLRSFLSESCSIHPIHPTDFNQPETHLFWVSLVQSIRFIPLISTSLKHISPGHVHKIFFPFLPPSHYLGLTFVSDLFYFVALVGRRKFHVIRISRPAVNMNTFWQRWMKASVWDKRLYTSSKGRRPQPRRITTSGVDLIRLSSLEWFRWCCSDLNGLPFHFNPLLCLLQVANGTQRTQLAARDLLRLIFSQLNRYLRLHHRSLHGETKVKSFFGSTDQISGELWRNVFSPLGSHSNFSGLSALLDLIGVW